MRMDNESTKKITNSLVEMARNILIDDPFPTFFAVVVKCNNCDDFHMHTFELKEIVGGGLSAQAVIGAIMFDKSASEMFISACKNIGASVAATNKEVIASAFVSCMTGVETNQNLDGKSIEEIHKVVENGVKEGSIEAAPSMAVATFARPDFYMQISYDVELLENNDALLVDRTEQEGKIRGNIYEPLEAIAESALFLSGVQIALCDDESKEGTPLSDDYSEKFHAFLYKIEMAMKIGDVI